MVRCSLRLWGIIVSLVLLQPTIAFSPASFVVRQTHITHKQRRRLWVWEAAAPQGLPAAVGGRCWLSSSPKQQQWSDHKAVKEDCRDKPQQQVEDNVNKSAQQLVQTTKLLSVRHKQLHNHQAETEDELSSFRRAKHELPRLLLTLHQAILHKPDDLTLSSLQNILVSLAHLVRMQKQQQQHSPVPSKAPTPPLARTVWKLLEERQATADRSPPQPWFACLHAATVLEFHFEPTSSSAFYVKLCHRLAQGDALARLEPYDLCQALVWGSQHYPGYLQPYEAQLVRAVARRLRKQRVRQAADSTVLNKALSAVTVLLRQQPQSSVTVGTQRHLELKEEDELTMEWKRLAYTLLNERLSRLDSDRSNQLALQETNRFFRCASFIVTSSDPLADRLVEALERHTHISSDDISFAHCAGIMETLTEWRRFSTAAVTLGSSLRNKYGSANDTTLWAHVSPKDVNSVFRGVALLYGNNKKNDTETTLAPYRALAEHVFQDPSLLLARCSVKILANFVWFASAVQMTSSTAVEALSRHMLNLEDTTLFAQCTPKLAARMLSSFTALIVAEKEEQAFRMREVLFQLFHVLGEFLLSNQLDAHDISSAMVAYAKAGYALDPGILGHLSATLQTKLEDHDHPCSERQVVQTLWALAKLSTHYVQVLNDGHNPKELDLIEEAAQVSETHAVVMVERLSRQARHLTTADIAQTLWACARMDLFVEDDDDSVAVLDPLLEQTRRVAPNMTAQEVTNSLWALSKIQRTAFDTIFVLTRRLRDAAILSNLKLYEASTVLASLAELDLREEVLFEKISQHILDNVEEERSTQDVPPAIARVLWAHKKVHLLPPRILLDHYAKSKLGLDVAQDQQNLPDPW